MNLDNITPQGYILAMIIRDDGERILLGDGAYVFKDNLQHFQPNTYANDVVELQGTDGQLLAGQVRRTAIQNFAGYIGDASTSQEQVEQYRKRFLMFFRKKFHYTAVYIFHDGSAIQRKRGYIANAPAVPELYQRYPEWSVGLNFEDPNYYEYAEDDEGNEIYAHAVEIAISNAVSGGLVWDNNGATSDELGYTGTPIEGQGKSFQLTGTGDKILKSAELLGDAEQTTYSGKNKSPNLGAYYDAEFNANAGASITSHTDSTIVLTTGTSGSSGIYMSKAKIEAICPQIYQDGYTVSLTIVSTQATDIRFNYNNKNTRVSIGTTATRISFQTDGSNTSPVVLYKATNDITPTLTISDIQVEAGSTATDYEPYVGGTASPNPDYPQEVNTVTGEQTVKIEGKNLLEPFNWTRTSAGITFTVADGEITASGTATANAFLYGNADMVSVCPLIDLPAGTYTCFADDAIYGVQLRIVDATDFANLALTAGSQPTTFTLTESHTVGINVRITSGTAISSPITFRPQLEKGSTANPTYEPYQGQTLSVNLGKNLFDLSSLSATNITVSDNEVYGSASAFNTAFSSTGIVVPTSSQFTLSIVGYTDGNQAIENTSGLGFRVGYTDGTYSSYTYWQNNNTTATLKTFTSDGNKTPDKLYFSFASKGQNIWHLSDIQLELGTTATTFAPYFTPIELAKIGDYQDYIFNDNGTWKIHKETQKLTFNGTENWTLGYTGTPNFMYILSNVGGDAEPSSGQISRLLKSNYGTDGNVGATNTDEGILIIVSTAQLRIRYGSEMTIDAWKAKLASNNMILYYALATPTDTAITNTALIAQLNALKHANTYNDITNFSTSSVNLNGFLKVKAYPKGGTATGGYIWEAGGAGGPTTITVEGVDDASPIWTVIGPATNPTLTNITTGQTITWTGTVPSGQELVIDMANQTASLSGANVFEFVSGSWVTLEPGNNRISYNATNATEPSKLEWNGVTG